MPQRIKKIIFCAGGSGGHFFPALSYAKLIKESYHIVFIINREEFSSILKRQGFKFYIFKIKYFRFRPSKDFLKTILLFLFNILESLKILLKEKPDIVFCFGNFTSFWIGILSKCFFKKLIIHEQNVNYGKVNKILGYIADEIGIQKWTQKTFKNKEIFLPLLLRETLPNVKKTGFVVLFFGGSQGSEAINNLFLKIYKDLLKFDMKVILITGKDKYKSVIEKINFCNNLEVYDFTEEIFELYVKAQVCVMRAGIMSIFEVLNFKVYPLIIPHQLAANHQINNALYFYKMNLGEVFINNLDEVSKRIIFLYKNRAFLEEFRSRIEDFLKEYTWQIFIRNFNLII